MAYTKYTYKGQKQKITKLLRKRLALKDKIRYHKKKVESFECIELPNVEEELQKLITLIESKE